MIGSFIDIYQQEGTRGLWRVSAGCGAPSASSRTSGFLSSLLSGAAVEENYEPRGVAELQAEAQLWWGWGLCHSSLSAGPGRPGFWG